MEIKVDSKVEKDSMIAFDFHADKGILMIGIEGWVKNFRIEFTQKKIFILAPKERDYVYIVNDYFKEEDYLNIVRQCMKEYNNLGE